MVWELELFFLSRTGLLDHLNHFWNHVARPLNSDFVSDPNILAINLVLVVQGCSTHRCSSQANRRNDRHRSQRTGPSDLNNNILDRGRLLSRWILERDHSSRAARDVSCPIHLLKAVELDHDTVDLKREPIALLFDL